MNWTIVRTMWIGLLWGVCCWGSPARAGIGEFFITSNDPGEHRLSANAGEEAGPDVAVRKRGWFGDVVFPFSQTLSAPGRPLLRIGFSPEGKRVLVYGLSRNNADHYREEPDPEVKWWVVGTAGELDDIRLLPGVVAWGKLDNGPRLGWIDELFLPDNIVPQLDAHGTPLVQHEGGLIGGKEALAALIANLDAGGALETEKNAEVLLSIVAGGRWQWAVPFLEEDLSPTAEARIVRQLQDSYFLPMEQALTHASGKTRSGLLAIHRRVRDSIRRQLRRWQARDDYHHRQQEYDLRVRILKTSLAACQALK